MNSYTATDTLTGGSIGVTGHRFLPIPCVDAGGVPTEDQTCAKTPAARSFEACVSCHGDETSAASALNAAETRIADLVTQLDDLLAQVRPTEFEAATTHLHGGRRREVQRGSRGSNPSAAVHNPFLTEALLRGSIQAVEDTYGVGPAPAASRRAETDALKALVQRWGS